MTILTIISLILLMTYFPLVELPSWGTSPMSSLKLTRDFRVRRHLVDGRGRQELDDLLRFRLAFGDHPTGDALPEDGDSRP